MRVDLVITELDVGGAEKCCVDLAIHLLRQGYHIRLIALGPTPKPDREQLYRKVQQAGIEPIFLNGRSWKDGVRTLRKLKMVVEADPPQIAMAFLFHANLFSIKVYSQLRIPCVANVRVADRSRVRALVSRLAYKKVQSIVCVSQSVADHVQHFEKADACKIQVIHNGIDIQAVDRETQELVEEASDRTVVEDSRSVIYVGRFESQKRIEWLNALASQPFFQTLGYQLVMVGGGSLESNVEAWCRGAFSRIVNLGRRSDVLGRIARSELLLLPSRYEGMPNVVLEAMACAKPVMCTDVEGVRELLGPNAEKQVSKLDDMQGWLNGIRLLLNDQDLRRELGEANRLRCEMHFNLIDKMREYERLLLSLVADNSNAIRN